MSTDVMTKDRPVRTQSSDERVSPAQTEAWHMLPVTDAIELQKSEVARGLTQAEAARRLVQFGLNALAQAHQRSTLSIFVAQFQSLIVALLVAAMAIAFAMGENLEAVAILVVIGRDETRAARTEGVSASPTFHRPDRLAGSVAHRSHTLRLWSRHALARPRRRRLTTGNHDGVHDAGSGPSLPRLQRAFSETVGVHQPAVYERLALGGGGDLFDPPSRCGLCAVVADVLHAVPPTLPDWGVIAACSLMPVVVVEFVKVIQRVALRVDPVSAGTR